MKSYLPLVLCTTLLIISCGQNAGNADFEMARTSESQPELSYEDQPAKAPGDGTEEADLQLPDRKIIRTAHLRMRVADLPGSRAVVEQAAAQQGGYVTSLEESTSSYEHTARLTIRVPAGKLDTFLAALDGESEFTHYKRIEAQDVSEEYLDIETRLETKRAVRDRYIDILRNKARTVEEVLMAEEKIRVIQEEIESREGRLRYLQSQVSMSTVHLELYETVEYVNEPDTYKRSFWSDLKNSLANGWELLRALVLGIITIWPLLLLVLLTLWKGGWLWRKIRK